MYNPIKEATYVTPTSFVSLITSTDISTSLGYIPINPASMATVATTGNYADLLAKPVLFSGVYGSLTGLPILFDGNYNSLSNKPTLATVATSGSYNDLSSKPSIQAPLIGTGFVKSTAGTISYDTNTYITGNQNISITGDASGSGTTAITLTLPNIVTTGTYDTVVVNAKGQVTSGRNKTQSSPTRSLNTVYQPSTTRDSTVHLSISISITSVLLGTNVGTVVAQISSDGITYSTVAQVSNSVGGVVSTNIQSAGISFFVPANYFVKLVTSQSGVNTPTFAISANQEVLY